jgi:dienelactone hydrolase
MQIERQRHIRVNGADNQPVLLDAFYDKARRQQPVVIFVHGFKGFKDWGTFDLIGERMVEAGYGFVKLNFSHNGVPPDAPYEITDPETFGRNTFSRELTDLAAVLDWVQMTTLIPEDVLDRTNLNLIGHSRGGSVVILKSAEDSRVQKGISWSAPADLYKRWTDEQYEQWRQEGVYYITNGRNGAQLPLYWEMAQDMEANRERFDVQRAIETMEKPFMVAHGTEDEAVPQEDAIQLKSWNSAVKLELVPGAGHTFGGYHPYEGSVLPQPLDQAVNASLRFLGKGAEPG